MIFALVWILGLVSTLFLVASAGALAFRMQGNWAARILAFVILLVSVGVLVSSYAGRQAGFRPSWFGYTASWTVTYLVLTVIVLALARRGRLARWRPSRLGIASGLGFLLLLLMLVGLDARERGRLTKLREDAFSRARPFMEQVPAEENAASAIFDAFELLDPIEDRLDFDYFRPDLDTTAPEVQEVLVANSGALELVRQGLRRSGFSVEKDLTDLDAVLDLDGRFSTPFRSAAYILVLEAKSRAARGDASGALESLDTIFGLAERLSQDPDVLSALVASALVGITASALEDIVNLYAAVLPSDLERTLFGYIAFKKKHEQVLVVEQAETTALTVAGSLGAYDSGEFDGLDRLIYALRRIFVPLQLEQYHTDVDEILLASRLPYSPARTRLSVVRQSFEARTHSPLAAFLEPNTRLLPELIKAEAHQRLISVALAVTAYRARHGKLPSDLESLIPELLDEVPIDPFDGNPLRAVSAPGSLILYSVGVDAEDDGGGENYDDTQGHGFHENGDLTFCFGKVYDERRRIQEDDEDE